MELIYIISGGLMGTTVDRYPVPDLILYNEHPQLFKLLAQILDVKTDNPVIQFHIRLMVKYL